MRRVGLLIPLLVSALPALGLASCDFNVTGVYSCDTSANPYTPSIHDGVYYIRADIQVTGTPSKPVTVHLEMADQVYDIPNQTLTAGTWYYWLGWTMPLDGKITCKASILGAPAAGDTNSANNHKSGSFTPTQDDVPILFAEPKTWTASQTASIGISAGFTKAQIYLGQPLTQTNQTVISDPGISGTTIVKIAPFNLPVYRKTWQNPHAGTLSLSHTFDVESRNPYINFKKIHPTWDTYANLVPGLQRWAQPDAAVQSDDPTIAAYVTNEVGPNFKDTMTPMDYARKMFIAVARDLTYLTPNPYPTAVDVLEHRAGDCAGMSNLYLACLRYAGIPCRPICGWRQNWDGSCITHCWTEMYTPQGWVPQDVTDCNGYSRAGEYAYCFATVSDLNSRVAVSYASEYDFPAFVSSSIQIGDIALYGPGYWTYQDPVVSLVQH